MALFGVYVALLGAWRYAVTDRGLARTASSRMSSATGYAIALFVVVAGAIVATALLSEH